MTEPSQPTQMQPQPQWGQQQPPPQWGQPGQRPAGGGGPGFVKRKGVQLAAVGLVGLLVGAGIGAAGASDTTVQDAAGEQEAELTEARADIESLQRELEVARAQVAVAQEEAEKARAAATEPAADPAPPAPAADAAAQSDGSFEVVEVQVEEDFAGDFGGTLRVRNTSGSEKSAIMTVTLLKGGSVVGSLQGSADGVGAGETATVQLISSDDYVDGPYETEFQVDTEF